MVKAIDRNKQMDSMVEAASADMDDALKSHKAIALQVYARWWGPQERDFNALRFREMAKKMAQAANNVEALAEALVQIDEEAARGPG